MDYYGHAILYFLLGSVAWAFFGLMPDLLNLNAQTMGIFTALYIGPVAAGIPMIATGLLVRWGRIGFNKRWERISLAAFFGAAFCFVWRFSGLAAAPFSAIGISAQVVLDWFTPASYALNGAIGAALTAFVLELLAPKQNAQIVNSAPKTE